MNRSDTPVPGLISGSKSDAGLWEAMTGPLDRILTVLDEHEAMLAVPTGAEEVLGIYIQALHKMTALAAQHALSGLEAVNQVMLRHVKALRAQRHGLSQEDILFLEQWPIHLTNHLAAPHNLSLAQSLVEHLQDVHWPLPLSAGEGKSLIALLLMQGDEATQVSEADIKDSAAPETSVSATEPSLSYALDTSLTADPDGDAESVLAELDRLLETAAQFGLSGLQSLCLHVQKNLSANNLNAAMLAEVQQFLALGMDYLAMPETADALVDCLKDGLWQQPLNNDEMLGLLSMLQDSPDTSNTQTAPAISAESLLPETPDAEATAAEAPLSRTEVAVDDDAERLTGLAMLLETASEFGLPGLEEMCLRVQQNIEHLQASNSLDAQAWERIEHFLTLGNQYLAMPETADALVASLQDRAWPQPLTDEEATGLLFVLHEGQMNTLASEPELVLPVDDAECLAPMDNVPLQPAMQSVNIELIGLLTQELEATKSELGQLLATAVAPEATASQHQEAIGSYSEQLERLAMAAETVGLTALRSLLAFLYEQVQRATAGLDPGQHEALDLLPDAMLVYLATPEEPDSAVALIALVQGDLWSPSLTDDQVTALQAALSMVQPTQESPDEPMRQTKASAEDMTLSLPDDLNQELLDGLLHELPIHTGVFSTAIQCLASGQGTLADIDVAKRAAHTLKGAANTVGIKGLANLTHHLEDILVALSKHATLPNRPLAKTLSNASDCLEAMGEAVMGTGPEPDYRVAILQEVLDWANRIDQDGLPAADEDTGPVTQIVIQDEAAPTDTATQASVEAMIRIPASLIDELLRLMGENIISTGQMRERLRRLIRQNRKLQQQNQMLLQLTAELEDQVDLKATGHQAGATNSNDSFDPLEFEHYNELHTLSRRLTEAATDASELARDSGRELGDLNELIEVQTQLNAQSQNTVLRSRMVLVSTVTSRLQRSVRQAARLLDKQVQLRMTGVDTMIDSNLLNDLVDPLMHILRNSVDHGIEMPEQRIASGKPAEGHISLSFQREGNQMVVRCGDDGAGFNLAAIRHSAQNKGLLTSGQNLSDDEVARLVFAPGFSTRDKTTQVSGRGIGMDVIYNRVLELKGTIDLHPNPGQGLLIEIRLPTTLISTYALLVREHQHLFAVSSYGITDIHHVSTDQVQVIGDEAFFRLSDDIYPLTDFAELLQLSGNRRKTGRHQGFPVLLVRQDGGAIQAVRVQEIPDSSEFMVKSLGPYVPRPQGVVGATILGDGSVAAVIDLPELMRKRVHGHKGKHLASAGTRGNDATTNQESQPGALVVDDSLSARRATAQFMKDAGFRVRTAIDGLEAVTILDKWTPDIMLIDMEMPRMNGLELTAHVRARPGMAELPIIMITSRSTEKHQRQAESAGVNIYLTKPFTDGQLLGHVMALTA